MKVVAFTSDKGGMGKSTAALNLACAAAEDRFEAAVLDLDPQASVGRWARVRRKAELPARPLAETCVPIDIEDRLRFARGIGLEPRTTPFQSPQSNGMAEAFVRTFKRDNVRVNAIPDAQTFMSMLPAWFAHYNEVGSRYEALPSPLPRFPLHRPSDR